MSEPGIAPDDLLATTLLTYYCQGWQGRGWSPTRAPRPRATRAARPGPAQTFVKCLAWPGHLSGSEF